MTKDQVTAKVGDKEITIGSGNITKQADGTVTVQMGETIVMTAVVAATKVVKARIGSHCRWITASEPTPLAKFLETISAAKAVRAIRRFLPAASPTARSTAFQEGLVQRVSGVWTVA